MIHWFRQVPGSVVVFLHGFAGDVNAWREVAEKMPQSQATAALTLPGHAPGYPACSDFLATCDALRGVLQSFEPRPIHLAGYSLGARLALGVALRHPHFLSRLTLIGGHIGLVNSHEQSLRVAADMVWVRLLESKGIDAFVRAWEAQSIFSTQQQRQPQGAQEQRERRLKHDARGLAQSLRTTGLGVMPNFWNELSSLSVPVTFIAGADDKKFSKLGIDASALTPTSSFHPITNCGHNPLLEAPAQLAKLLTLLTR